MSAFVISDKHLNVIINSLPKYWESTFHHITRLEHKDKSESEIKRLIAKIFIEENIKSVNYRYSNDYQGLSIKDFDLRFSSMLRVDALSAIKLLHCLDYQSCEHREYDDSLAKKLNDSFCNSLIRSLEEYEEASWAI